MIEVFKTNVDDPRTAAELLSELLEVFPHCRINFDLDDCDKILRVAGEINPVQVIEIVSLRGYCCEVLE